MACDCTDCKGISRKFYWVRLTDEYGGDECVWCEDCLLENISMVEDCVLLKAPFDGRRRCPSCGKPFEVVASSRDYFIYGCPDHREYDRPYYFED